MDWIPIVFVIFKVAVLATGMYYAVKWHYDQGKKDADSRKERRAVLRGAAKVVILFVFALAALGLLTWLVLSHLSLDMGL